MDAHLDYDKHSHRKEENSRKGYSTKTIKTSYGDDQIKVPRDRDASYNPMIIPKRKSMVKGLENVIVSLYAKGMSVLTDLKARGTEDILITATDNLNDFTEIIRIVFPESKTQICIVHQIRNAPKYVVWKNKKQFTSDMKNIYNALNKESVAAVLEDFGF